MIRWCTVCILALLVVSCTTRHVTPTRASRRAIDTLFQQQVLLMQPQVDSLCKHVKDSVYTVAVDSFLQERQAEMNQLVK
jgi:hypothetical protein